jgi:hypothetical protein
MCCYYFKIFNTIGLISLQTVGHDWLRLSQSLITFNTIGLISLKTVGYGWLKKSDDLKTINASGLLSLQTVGKNWLGYPVIKNIIIPKNIYNNINICSFLFDVNLNSNKFFFFIFFNVVFYMCYICVLEKNNSQTILYITNFFMNVRNNILHHLIILFKFLNG